MALVDARPGVGAAAAGRGRQADSNEAWARLIYTRLPVPADEIAAVLLLVAIIAAIALTVRRRKDVVEPGPSRCVPEAADRVRIVKMAAWSKHAGGAAVARNGAHSRDMQPEQPAGAPAHRPVRAVDRRHLPEPPQPHRAADAINLMPLAVNLNFVAFAPPGRPGPGIFVFFHPHGGGGRLAIGLAILVVLFRGLAATSTNWIPQGFQRQREP